MVDQVPKVIGGADVIDFITANTPTNVPIPLEKKKAFFKGKKYGKVTIEIKLESGDSQYTRLLDEFNLRLDADNLSDNTKVVQEKLQLFKEQIGNLIVKWTQEISR